MNNIIFLRERGATTLLLTTILLMTASMIIIFAASYSMMQQKIASNQYQSNQAYEAAEAGLEYGIVYLQKNSATILANPNNGYIQAYSDSNITNVTLANNNKFSIVYSNPIAYNYKIIQLVCTGTNSDGTSTKVISQGVAVQGLTTPPSLPSTLKGNVTLSDYADISNYTAVSSAPTISSGGSVVLTGNATTSTWNGGSSVGNIRSDIQQNVSMLTNITNADLFAQYFSVTSNAMKKYVTNFYTTNYILAAGQTGVSIWIDQAVNFSGSTTIGASNNPVLIIINGDLQMTDNVILNGLVYVLGSVYVNGNASINGALVATGALTIITTGSLTFNNSILNKVKQLPVLNYWAKIPGSWKDF